MTIIKPGNFGKNVPADNRRGDFDFGNEQVLYLKRSVDILFIGDSITQLWDHYAYFGTKCYIVNRGIGGDSSEYMCKRFDADCIQLHPKKAVMMIGTNDISRTDYDFWWRKDGEAEETVLADYKENVSEMVKKGNDAGIELLICSVPPSDIAPPQDKEKRYRMAAEMNAFLKSLGKEYIDFVPVLSDDGKTFKAEYTHDGIHPNAAGYLQMANEIKKHIKIV